MNSLAVGANYKFTVGLEEWAEFTYSAPHGG